MSRGGEGARVRRLAVPARPARTRGVPAALALRAARGARGGGAAHDGRRRQTPTHRALPQTRAPPSVLTLHFTILSLSLGRRRSGAQVEAELAAKLALESVAPAMGERAMRRLLPGFLKNNERSHLSVSRLYIRSLLRGREYLFSFFAHVIIARAQAGAPHVPGAAHRLLLDRGRWYVASCSSPCFCSQEVDLVANAEHHFLRGGVRPIFTRAGNIGEPRKRVCFEFLYVLSTKNAPPRLVRGHRRRGARAHRGMVRRALGLGRLRDTHPHGRRKPLQMALARHRHHPPERTLTRILITGQRNASGHSRSRVLFASVPLPPSVINHTPGRRSSRYIFSH